MHDLKRRVVLAPEDADARYALAEALFGDQQVPAAIEQLERALALAPEHGNARRLLARSYREEGRPVLAERTLTEAVRWDPADAAARDELAALLLEVGRVDDALLHLEEALCTDGRDLTRRLLAAELYCKRRLPERARAHLQEAERLAPGDVRVTRARAELELLLGESPGGGGLGPLDRGAEFLLGRTRQALALPSLREAMSRGALHEAAVRLRQGDLPGAKRALIAAEPAERTAAFEFLRGELLLAEGEFARAEKVLRQGLAREPALGIGWSRLGELLARDGRHEEALAAGIELVRLQPDDADALEALGDAYAALGRTAEAIEQYRRALDKVPGGSAAAKLALIRTGARTSEQEERPVGRVAALGWVPTGGVVSELEAVAIPGPGELLFTGNVGRVGQDAARVAFSCLKARASQLGIEDEVRRLDLHLHFTDTELAKDGPSAGLALALAGFSAYTGRPLRPRLAASGEITLQGAIRPVGGLHEKLVAACLYGIRTVLLPRKNLFEARELPPEVTRRVAVFYVDSLSEALEAAMLEKEA